MRIFYGFSNLPKFRNAVVTMGSYDGVHVGHRTILSKISELARENNGESIVITFSPHPRIVLNPQETSLVLLNSLQEKAMLLEKVGIDNLIVVEFTKDFSMLSSHDFVKNFLIDKVCVSTLVIGYNHHFGHNKEGDYSYLQRLQTEFNFATYEIPRQAIDSNKLSSTQIRTLIQKGDMQQAKTCLAEPYFIICRYSQNRSIVWDEKLKLLPPDGTYSASIQLIGSSDQPTTVNVKLTTDIDRHIYLSDEKIADIIASDTYFIIRFV